VSVAEVQPGCFRNVLFEKHDGIDMVAGISPPATARTQCGAVNAALRAGSTGSPERGELRHRAMEVDAADWMRWMGGGGRALLTMNEVEPRGMM
jgi:hypothetical protein